MPKKEKVFERRKMKVVRSWINSQFKYFMYYNDGVVVPTTRREALQYAKAYGVEVPTIVGKPEDHSWISIGK
jgi:hypothetical protein